jgi:hypothetical protein
MLFSRIMWKTLTVLVLGLTINPPIICGQDRTQTADGLQLEGAFTPARAMKLVYGSYDDWRGVSIWQPRRAKAYPEYWPDSVNVRVLLDASYVEPGIPRHLLVTWALPKESHEDEFTCHACSLAFAQKLPLPTRMWSVGPLTTSEPVVGISFGAEGAKVTPPHVDSQTGSTFAATRSVVFASDRIVLASMLGMRKVEGAQLPAQAYQLLSLDAKTGEVKDTREILAFTSLEVFATNDAHVIVSGRSVLRLTPDLKDDGSFDYNATGHKFGRVQNASPDGSTLGNATSPGFELVDARTLKATPLTANPAVDTSISSKGFVTDNTHWIRDYPKDLSFITYTDITGEHLLYHGKCGGRPQFLSDDLVLEPGCKSPLIVDTRGNLVRTLSVKGEFSFAGVSQNSKRFALQLASFSATHSIKQERFVIYSVDTGDPVAQVTPEKLADEQSWTAFSPDGSMFVVGSPLKLTLYRLP